MRALLDLFNGGVSFVVEQCSFELEAAISVNFEVEDPEVRTMVAARRAEWFI